MIRGASCRAQSPQFEANDAASGQGYEVWKEAVNNVLFDDWNAGSHYRTGVEEGAGNLPFRFHFLKNLDIRNSSRTSARDIEADRNYGVTNTIKVHVSGNTTYPHSQDELGGWPTLNTYNIPTDTDRDGMPDCWETSLGMNPYVVNHNHTNPDGYTDLEHYLTWLVGLHAGCAQDGFVDVNLRNFTAGMASNATYTVSNPTNGIVSLLGDGRTARFTPAGGFFGRGSFQFTSLDTLAGGGMTNTVQTLVTPVAAPPRFTAIAADQGTMVLRGSGGLPCARYYALTSPKGWGNAIPAEQQGKPVPLR